MPKQFIHEEITNFSIYDLEGPLDCAIGLINILDNNIYQDKSLRIEDNTCFISGNRLETDEEYNSRIEQEKLIKKQKKKLKELRINDEKALYEKLKKKYGDK
jgi:hypothetical protein